MRYTLSLISGILLVYCFPFVNKIPLAYQFAFLFIAVAVTLFFTFYLKSYRYRWLNGLFAGLSFALAGILITGVKLNGNQDKNFFETKRLFLGEIVAEPALNQESVKAMMSVAPVDDSLKKIAAPVKALLFFNRDSISENLRPGDILLFYASLRSPEPPKNPNSFNYKNFLKQKGIYYISFVNTANVIKTGNSGRFVYFPYRLRKKLLNVLKNNGITGKGFSVASAILLGYDKLMDASTLQNYSGAGAVHVLCVSGLHVGIIYLVFGFLFSFLRKTKKERIMKAVVLLFIIWFYAVITGLAPSVWRASVMISLFIVGNSLKRELNPYNTLAASAFIMLFINPLLLFDVGFQLSYAAVLGILIFYKPVYSIFYFQNKIVDTFWSVIAVSISAQAGAFPLAAHYFHTFPLYFLLTNLAVFALAYVIIIAGMLFFIFSPLKFIASILGTFLSSTVYLMNLIVKFVSSLPHAQLQNLYFPWFKTATVYALMLTLFFWLWKKRAEYLRYILLSLLLLAGFQTVIKWKRLTHSELIVFNSPCGCAVDVNRGENHLLLTDSSLFSNPPTLNYAVSGYLLHNGLNKNLTVLDTGNYKGDFFIYRNGFLAFKNTKIFIAGNKTGYFPRLNPVVGVDFLILNGMPPARLKQIKNSLDFKHVVIPASYSKYQSKKAKEILKSLNVSCYDIACNGAFVFQNGKR